MYYTRIEQEPYHNFEPDYTYWELRSEFDDLLNEMKRLDRSNPVELKEFKRLESYASTLSSKLMDMEDSRSF